MELSSRDREVLVSWVRSTSIPAGLALRARIVLLAAEGVSTGQIMARTGVSKPTVIGWKQRYAAEGLAGLRDRPRPGRPRTADDVAIVLATLEPPPERLGVKRWSSRVLARELGVSNVKVADVWREYGLQPWKHDDPSFSTRPQLNAKIRDVVGLYVHPPDNAVALSTDKSRIHARNRTPVTRPPQSGRAVPTCAGQFVPFLQRATAAHAGQELHVVLDNDGSQQGPDVRSWLARNPKATFHVTSSPARWLNLVEIFLGIASRNAPHHGNILSATEIISAINEFLDNHGNYCKPFIWIKENYGDRFSLEGSVKILRSHLPTSGGGLTRLK